MKAILVLIVFFAVACSAYSCEYVKVDGKWYKACTARGE